jgi:hypothetical protein
MVSGHIFHCRRNSWPAEEYVARTALQLVSPGSSRASFDRGELFLFASRFVLFPRVV